jgi:hypothetical protein
MTKIRRILSGARAPGVYRLSSRASADSLRRQLAKAGWRLFCLDGREIKDKASFLRAASAEMDFPGYASRNWDAFEELVNDLSWVPAQGYVVLLDHAADFELGQPRVWSTVTDILGDAVTTWAESESPMYVLIRGGEAVLPEL